MEKLKGYLTNMKSKPKGNKLQVKQQKNKWTLDILTTVHEVVLENPEMNEKKELASSTIDVLSTVFDSCNDNRIQAMKYSQKVAEIFNFCKDQEWIDGNNTELKTLSYQVVYQVMQYYLYWHRSFKDIMKLMFAGIKEIWDCEDSNFRKYANNLITMMPGADLVEIDKEVAIELIDRYISGEENYAQNNFTDMVNACPDVFDGKFEELAAGMVDMNSHDLSCMVWMFDAASKTCPEKLSPKTLQLLIDNATTESGYGYMIFKSIKNVTEKYPQNVIPLVDQLTKKAYENRDLPYPLTEIFVPLCKGSEERTGKYLKISESLTSACDTVNKNNILWSMKLMGEDYPNQLAKHKKFFQSCLQNPNYKQYAEMALNAMHGRSLAKVAKDVKETQDDVEQIDDRVTTTDANVDKLDKDVKIAQVDMAAIANDIVEQTAQLEELEEVVEKTVEKVEEIDKKTLSHAPTWSRDVAKIMNEKSDHDWRLLSSRLGYSNEDIRNWATQPDPCLSMFDEWFAKHKTREATHAILKHLEEMNRTDAAMIVENALKRAEDVVEDEEQDYATPPPVFISYQWGVQNEVKLFKKHLDMAGYESWMDIGQMGGGDKLFEKIDSGIRAAKVIICCVTEKYAKSPNCNREVNLAVNLGKPIIPLLMEKMAWPPEGAMGPIFGEYLFIRFFARPGEGADDDRYWPIAKFQELIMQIRYNVVPNEELIKNPYKNWQSPPEEIIVVKPRNTNGHVNKEKETPDVFISYQWGKQPQIKQLYKQLSMMGYTCWLDIMQMGGGDSLHDKIDKGVRGCKVVLTCVTKKYSLSANCRREVSLADALKKPVVPLLLEQITWPPEGPMSMVFTQLLYINFCKPDISVQNHWKCPQMEELISKINAQVPHMAIHTKPDKSVIDVPMNENDKPEMVPEVKQSKNDVTDDVDWGDDNKEKQKFADEVENPGKKEEKKEHDNLANDHTQICSDEEPKQQNTSEKDVTLRSQQSNHTPTPSEEEPKQQNTPEKDATSERSNKMQENNKQKQPVDEHQKSSSCSIL